MSSDTPYKSGFEQHLADKVAEYWHGKGHIVRTWLEGPPHASYPRSNLMNGLPQGPTVPGVQPKRIRGVRA